MQIPRTLTTAHLTRLIAVAALGTCVASAQQKATELISQSTTSVQTTHESVHASISNDGDFVAFSTLDLQLDPSHVGTGNRQVYVRDATHGVTQRINLTTVVANPPAPGDSFEPSISATGCAVAFTSNLPNLTLTSAVIDTNGNDDVFVRWATPLSGGFGGCTVNGPDNCASSYMTVSGVVVTPCSTSDQPCISGDGAFVAFRHYVNDLSPQCDLPVPTGSILASPTLANVWLADVTTSPPQLWLCSDLAISPGFGVGESSNPVVSFDGRFVAFESLADLVPPDANPGRFDIFRFDRNTVSLIQVSPGGELPRDFTTPSISDDGSVIAFDDDQDVYVAVITGGVVSISTITSSATGNGGFDPSVSPDGRFVAFVRAAGGGPGHVMLFDRVTSIETKLDVDALGVVGNGLSTLWRRALSDDAVVGAFSSTSHDLVANDSNAVADVFTHGPADYYRAFCFGDGSGTSCPCGNATTSNFGGCPHSASVDGARLRGAGVPTVSYDSAALVVDALPNATSLVWFDYSLSAIPAGVVATDGLLCLGGTSTSLGSTNAIAGVASLGFHAQIPLSVSLATSAFAGQTQYFQARYRNSATFCTSSTVNSTNALQAIWRP
jgi:Tol biopolymer transport system component